MHEWLHVWSSLLLDLFQSTSLLIYNSLRTQWYHIPITQWYNIPAYQALISLYMCDFAYVPVAGNMSDFQYHDCHGLNAGRSVDLLKQHMNSGILVARYPNIYKEIIMCDSDTNLKAKRNRKTPRFRLHRYHVPVDVTMISVALTISFWRRQLRYQNHTEELPNSSVFLYINLLQFYQILSQTRVSRRIPSVKHVKHNAKE